MAEGRQPSCACSMAYGLPSLRRRAGYVAASSVCSTGRRCAASVCGELWPDEEPQSNVDLSFREACNKIIHAKSIRIEEFGLPTW